MPLPQVILNELFGAEGEIEGVAPKRGEEIFEGTDYPREWVDFIGQTDAKEQLQVQVASAAARGTRIEHTLLASGLHGVGKTTLACLMAYSAGVGLVQTTGPLSVTKAQAMMESMENNDILFIDEAHLLVGGSKNQADWLLPFMTEGVLYTPQGAKKMPNIAIVAATTDAGKLPQTLLSRFMCTPTLVAYTPGEGAWIAEKLAERMGVENLAYDHLDAISLAADNNPRVMRKILTQIRNLGYANADTFPNLDKAFAWAGVSRDGLTSTARDILVVLLASKDYTASIESIRAHLGEPGPLHHHEQQLLQRGFVTVTGRGRTLNETGVQRAREEVDSIRKNG